jgi:hypothetical protein
MPIFDVGSPAYQGPTSVGSTTPVKIWSGTVSALASISPAVTVRDLTIMNTGVGVLWVCSGSAAPVSSAGSTGVAVPAGGQLTLQGWTAVTNTTTNDVWGIGQTNSGTVTAVAGLGTLISVV